MTKDEIYKMAQKANLPACHITHPKALERFAELVREHERNEIIEILDASTGYVQMDLIRERI